MSVPRLCPPIPQHELYARVATQGGELTILATLLMPALKLPKP